MKYKNGDTYETGELVVRNKKGRLCLFRQCKICGNDFYADLANVKKGYGYTCGLGCAKFFKGHKPKEKCVCQNCGKEFEEFSSRIKDGRGIYCSKKCLNKSKEKEKLPRPWTIVGKL